ncbi:MAG: hypothetical protein AB1782_12040 [Cyanobacteriota bacterium]
MLECKPQKYIQFWKLSFDEEGKNIIELLTHNCEQVILRDHFAEIWNLIDGFNTIENIIDSYDKISDGKDPGKNYNKIMEALKELEKNELIILNWNPFG